MFSLMRRRHVYATRRRAAYADGVFLMMPLFICRAPSVYAAFFLMPRCRRV